MALPRADVYHRVGTPPQSDVIRPSPSIGDAEIAKLLVLLAAVTFVLAVVGGAFTGNILGIGAEAYLRACTNLALMAIAVVMVFKEEGAAG